MSSAESEVVDAIPSEQKSAGLFKVAVAVAAGATSMGGVRKAVGQSVRQVGHLGGAVREGLNGVPEGSLAMFDRHLGRLGRRGGDRTHRNCVIFQSGRV